MIEDRLDSRLQSNADLDEPKGLAQRWKSNRRDMEAAAFDNIADQIEAGLLRISGDPTAADVVDRLRGRAEGTRNGTDRMHRRRTPQ